MLKPYKYETCCIDCTEDEVPALNAMTASAKETTYEEMLKHCDLMSWAIEKGYEKHPNAGLTLRHDHHVAYYTSTFKGHPCYYLVWSAIEFIWTNRGK